MPASSSAPSHVFIVRHGNRLDAANSQWALSSATPYDTPLTYGGWLQSRNVGLRISTIIQSYNESLAKDAPADQPRPKRRTRFVIHSSPFQRCIQTSVSLASGIAQHHHQKVENTHWLDENGKLQSNENVDPESRNYMKPLLRIDAWLGEWMSADYYTDIAPPPASPLMVGNAKSEYLRPGPQLSGSNTPSVMSPVYNMSSLAAALPTLPAAVTGGFVPPVATYAMSTNEEAPLSYLSHAKNYVELDIGWDSAKIGPGGEFEEEWTAMHKRFRNGFKKLLWWYYSEDPKVATASTAWKKRCIATGFSENVKKDDSGEDAAVATTGGNPTPPLSDAGDELEDEVIDTVVILVTHGAGCNALVGAITGQPVLIDFGLASLTMGVRRAVNNELPPLLPVPASAVNVPHRSYSSPHFQHGSLHSGPVADATASASPEPPVSYEIKLLASKDHLRPALRPGTPTIATPPISPLFNPRSRSGTLSSFMSTSSTSSLGSVLGTRPHRSQSTGAQAGLKSTGLWGSPVIKATEEDTPATPIDSISPPLPVAPETPFIEKEVLERAAAATEVQPKVMEPNAAKGLWAARAWNQAPKRRWTVDQNDLAS